MGTYYLDIETTGLDPRNAEIITIQYQELERRTGLPLGDLTVLKSWESSEKEILNQIACRTRITDDYRFAFIPVGYNLGFEDRFLRGRPQAHGLPAIDVLSRPCIDLQGPAILMNRGEFKGASLDKITAKSQSGGSVPDWVPERQV